jgi:HK97 family phage prohead protease
VNDHLEIKAALSATDEGDITGIAWPFGSADSTGDIIVKGAFGMIPADLPMLYQHDPADLVGTWSAVTETSEGLTVKGRLHLDHPRARSVLSMIKSKLVGGLSIGFRTIESKMQGRNRVITALDLVETSIVRNPAHPKARITSAKSNDSAIALAALIDRFAAAIRTPH